MTTRVASTLWVLTAVACVIVLTLTITIDEPLPPLPVDRFWLAWVGLPVVGVFILVKSRNGYSFRGRLIAGAENVRHDATATAWRLVSQ